MAAQHLLAERVYLAEHPSFHAEGISSERESAYSCEQVEDSHGVSRFLTLSSSTSHIRGVIRRPVSFPASNNARTRRGDTPSASAASLVVIISDDPLFDADDLDGFR